MTDNNDGFLREIEEELSREKYQQLWDRYGYLALAAVALFVAGVGGFQYYKSASLAAAEAAGARYAEAQLESDAKDASIGAKVAAANAFKGLTEDGPVGYTSLARLQLAGARMETGKTDEALKVFEVLSKNSSADPLLRDYASLQAAALRVGKADFTEMQNRLTPLSGDDNAWRFSAWQLMGLAAAEAGNNKLARTYFGRLLGDPDTPPSVRQRANLLMTKVSLAETKASAKEAPKSDGEAKKAVTGETSKSGDAKSVSDAAAVDEEPETKGKASTGEQSK